MTAFSTLLAAGSCLQNSAGHQGPLFCDVESAREFTVEELQARRPYRANLERDLVTNQTGERHCGWKPLI